MTRLPSNASGQDRAGRANISTCAGPSGREQTSSLSCGSSSPRPWPTASWPNTGELAWTTPSTCGGARSRDSCGSGASCWPCTTGAVRQGSAEQGCTRRDRALLQGLSEERLVSCLLQGLSEAPRRVSRMATKAMTRSPGHRCTECGWSAVKWVGRCGECQAWGTVAEIGAVKVRTTAAVVVERPAIRIGEVDARQAEARCTGVSEFDRVLGGGLVRGAVVLVAGEPGIGKSTLLLDVAARAARQDQCVLYVSGEESAAQIRMRAERIDAMADDLFLAAETDLATVLGQISRITPDLVVIDSVQTIASGEVEGAAGNVSQIREVAASLIQVAKARGISILLVGHVTKDGSIAGPRVLEHLVDVVIQFEGDRHSRLRLVRAVKNRYGPTDEVGCFDLSDVGIVGLPDPSGLFLSSRDLVVPGTCVTVALEGRRPLVTEVQALLSATTSPSPRRTTSGLDSSRVAMILAVLDKRANVRVRQADCYVSTVGGV